MSTHKYSRVTLNRRKSDKVFKSGDAEVVGGDPMGITVGEESGALQDIWPMFSSLLGATISLYMISFYAELRYLEMMGLYLALAPLVVGFFVSAVFYCLYAHIRYSTTKNAHKSQVKGLDICIVWRKVCIPILFHLAGIVAIVLICLRLNGVLQRYEWVYIFTPLYIMDLLMASFIIKSSEKECWQRPLVAFITWASGSTFFVLLALQLNDKINFPPFILFIPMYVNVVVLIPYLLYWLDAESSLLCCFIMGVMFFIALTIVLIVLHLCSIGALSWPVCMIPLMILTTIGTFVLLVLKVMTTD